MKKRTRKKHHIGEYTELGFEVKVPDAFMSDEALDRMIEFVEAHGMGIGGSAEGAYVTSLEGGSLTVGDRYRFVEYCAAQPDWGVFGMWRVEGLTDAWHDYHGKGTGQPRNIHPRGTK